jgi:hypothetical protein
MVLTKSNKKFYQCLILVYLLSAPSIGCSAKGFEEENPYNSVAEPATPRMPVSTEGAKRFAKDGNPSWQNREGKDWSI